MQKKEECRPMASKYQKIADLYESAIRQVTSAPTAWTAFLRSACRNYERVHNLYRVSTKKQVDYVSRDAGTDVRPDIPMQKRAYHAFIDSRPDWVFYDELA
jgi:hypothetical protein